MAKKKEPKSYDVLVGIDRDSDSTRFEPGEVVTDKDFPAKVIKNWLEIGVLDEVKPKKKGGA